MTDELFLEAYKTLNEEQRKAIDSIEGPVMVIAGPGTGKTQILTLRIANILRNTDTRPENILALTFTESGALAMRERLRKYIGADAYRVKIHTFHGFATELIRAYPDSYTKVIGGRPASELEKLSIIESIIETGGIKHLRPSGNPAYYVVPVLRMIAKLKQEYITPDRFAEIISAQEDQLASIEKIHEKGAHKGKVRGEYTKKETAIHKNRELLTIYRQYEALMREQALYDFDDMIVETVTALREREEMRFDLQETYQYILADEHQDVNGSQNAILELLAHFHERPNIFVVGDEKQAIYRFQGASLENFLYFEDAFSHTETIALTDNYRSGQTILDAAHSLIASDDGMLKDLRVPLFAQTVKESVVEQRAFSHQAVEDLWVSGAVKAEIDAGTKPEEIAVIVRTNREVEQMAALLRSQGISVRASADGDILAHPITTTVCSLIDATVASSNEASLATLLHSAYWGITANDLVQVLRARSYDQSLAGLIEDEEKLRACGVSNTESVLRVGHVLSEARARMATEAPHTVLSYLISESGLLDHIMQHDPIEGGRVLRRLYDEVETLVVQDPGSTLGSIANMFAKLKAYNIALTAPYISTNTSAVCVMTAHKSKGLEFDAVFVPHLTDNLWGSSSTRNYFDIPLTRKIDPDSVDAADDERRLLYVAMTRARKRLVLSSAHTNSEGKDLIPSRLLLEIDAEHLTVVPTEEAEAAFDPLAALKHQGAAHPVNPALFVEILKERGLSATSLNNYLSDPWNYIYRNALRIPEVQAEHLLFGTALHNVVERVTKRHTKDGVLPQASEVKALLEAALGKLPLTTESFTRRHEQGFAALATYLHTVGPSLPVATREEFTLRVALQTGLPEFPEVMLTGKLDRLDLDAEGRVLRVVDYKTGKPKSRNQIEGNTKNADGGYKRQLVFYALLLSLYAEESTDNRYNCKECALSFLEPDPKGMIHEESFTITDEEIEALKKEIVRVVGEIVRGELLTYPIDESTSDYAHLARQLKVT